MAGNINAGKVFVELELRYSKMLAGMKSFTGSMVTGFKSAFTQIDSQIQKISGRISSMFSLGRMLIGGALVGGASMIMNKVIDKGDNIADNSRKMTVSPEKYQFFDYASEKSGADIGNVAVGIKEMTRLIDDAKTKGSAGAKALDTLNLSAKNLQGLTTDQKFDTIAAAIAAIPDPADRAAAAMAVFGSRSGTEILPMIEDMEKLKVEFEALNTMMSNEAVEAADKFNDSMLNLKTSLTNLIANSGIISWLGGIVEGMNSVVSIGDKLGEKSGIGAPGSAGYRGGVSGFVSNFADAGAAGSGWNPLNWAGKGLHALGVGEQEGDTSLKATDTAADKKKLADADKAFKDAGEKNLAQREAAAALAAEKAKADRLAAAEAEKTAEALSDMGEEIKLQDLINSGKEREAAIDKVLYSERKKLGRDLTQQEMQKFTDNAGKLYDV
ncbi:MAG: hypothetical protein NT118_09195, partial [Lentisphaerae bacterium]|nr:hypothetical protein [Lentisphaerota bacterium]